MPWKEKKKLLQLEKMNRKRKNSMISLFIEPTFRKFHGMGYRERDLPEPEAEDEEKDLNEEDRTENKEADAKKEDQAD